MPEAVVAWRFKRNMSLRDFVYSLNFSKAFLRGMLSAADVIIIVCEATA